MTRRHPHAASHESRLALAAVFLFLLTPLLHLWLPAAGAQLPPTVLLQPATSPTAAEVGVSIVNVTGSGFPAGTIAAGSTKITLTPATAGPAMTATVNSVVTIIGTTRRISFQVWSPNPVSSPTLYKLSVSGATATGIPFASSNTSALTINPSASITLSPASGTQGQTLGVTFNGNFTNFFQGSTVASLGPGISVGGAAPGAKGPLTVTNPTTATAQIHIGTAAATGPVTATVTTGSEVASSLFTINLLQVAPLITTNPSNLTVTAGLPATLTAAASGTPAPTVQWQVSTNGGVTFSNIPGAVSPTLSFIAIVLESGNQYRAVFTNSAGTATTTAAILTVNGIPALLSVNPNSGQQGQQNETVNLIGQFTHWLQGTTMADFGAGIAVTSLTVNSLTTATAKINIDPAATPGMRKVAVTTAAEFAAINNAFNVNPGTPLLNFVNPSSGQQGQQNETVNLAGQFTHWIQGTTMVNFGPGITVTNLTVNSLTTAAAKINIDPAATPSMRNVTVTTGAEVVTFNNGFTVNPGTPLLNLVNPSSGQQGQQNETVNLAGQFTHWMQGTSTADFGPGILVTSLTVNSLTTAAAKINIDPAATLGVRTVKVTTGAEVVTLANGFSVQTASIQPASLRVLLSDNVVAPDESITVTPQALDSAGNVITDPSLQFNITITAAGSTSGNAPVITGTSIKFPRIIKRLLNQNTTLDPNGLFADTDPTDPNYGKETGGFYNVNVTLVGSALSAASAGVTVVPTGTAGTTLKAKKYASQLQNVLSEGTTALKNHDLTGVAKTETDINLINGNTTFSAPVLGANNVLAPPNGFLMTVSQLLSAGFVANASDSQIGAMLVTDSSQIQQAIARLQLVNPAALTQTDVNDLQAIASSYKTIFQQLKALQPSAIGVTQQGALYNELLRRDLPQLLDTVTTLSNGILQQVTPFVIANASRPGLRLGPRAPVCPRPSAFVQPQLLPARYVVNGPSHRPRYQKRGQARLRNAQFIDFFFTTFGILTDLEGTALNNIITLSISLANDILNIEAANLINGASTGSLTVDTVVGSASLSFICPNYPNSFVEGAGYSTDTQSMEVVVIGCVNASAIASLITLSVPKDIAAAIRLINDINTLASELPDAFNVVALTKPDSVTPGLFVDTELDLNFVNGWPRVNQGSIPCAGLVFVANLATGGFAAANDDFLGVCQ